MVEYQKDYDRILYDILGKDGAEMDRIGPEIAGR